MIVYGFIHLRQNEWKFETENAPWINTDGALSFVGIAAYQFEGIGVIIPIFETAENPKNFKKLLLAVLVSLTVLYVTFPTFCVFVWGTAEISNQALITEILPGRQAPVIIIKILQIFNVIITYPLAMYPTQIITERVLFGKMPKSRK